MMCNFMYNKTKGFTLIQVMVILLITAVVIAASMPLITRKIAPPPKAAAHGKWACTMDKDGNLISAGARSSHVQLTNWRSGCEFPKVPDKVRFFVVNIIGGGAAGQDAEQETIKQGTLYPLSEDTELIVPAEGEYIVMLTSGVGDSPNLLSNSGSTFSYSQNFISGDGVLGVAYKDAQCYSYFYSSALPAANATISFRRTLNYKDTLKLKPPVSSSLTVSGAAIFTDDNSCRTICPEEGTSPSYCYGDIFVSNNSSWASINAPTPFQYPSESFTRMQTVKNGADTELLLNNSSIARVEGGRAGGWTANIFESGHKCKFVNCARYTPVNRTAPPNPCSPLGSSCNYAAGRMAPGIPQANSISPVNDITIFTGGCGGAAGESVSILVQQADNGGNPLFDVAASLVIGQPGRNPGNPGGTTSFAGVMANGGNGCAMGLSDADLRTSGPVEHKGGKGGSAFTPSPKDSIGGLGAAVSSSGSRTNSKEGVIIGAGGGGGALYKVGSSSNFEKLPPGAGSYGGIIVTW